MMRPLECQWKRTENKKVESAGATTQNGKTQFTNMDHNSCEKPKQKIKMKKNISFVCLDTASSAVQRQGLRERVRV
eukprot:753159-Amphidinium_carterae.1